MATSPSFPGPPSSSILQLVPGHSTRFRPVLGGAHALKQIGDDGCRLYKVGISSGDAGANKVQFAIGKILTRESDMGTGSHVDGGGGSDTITRQAGSFVADGWVAGMRLGVLGSTTLANDYFATLTAVSALTLTFATNTVNTAEDFPDDAVIVNIINQFYIDVAAGAGQPSVVGVSGLNTTQAPFLDASPDRIMDLGSDDILLAAVNTALTSGEYVDIWAQYADF